MDFDRRWTASGPFSVIVANAPNLDLHGAIDVLRAAADIIAADGGATALLQCGLMPQLLIGDLDSLPAAQLSRLQHAGCAVVRHPAEKDETDLELALLSAVQRGARRILVFGALGGRWDQSLANVALLALPELAGCEVVLRDGDQTVRLIRDRVRLEGAPDSVVSLLPFGGAAAGITTANLAYPLADAVLRLERSRGVSNRIISSPAEVQLRSGMLLVICDEP